MGNIVAYFDGACEPRNPGGAMGIGALLKVNGKTVWATSLYYEPSQSNTNNCAEYIAMGLALRYLVDNGYSNNEVAICGDSQLVIKQMTGEYGMKEGLYIKYARRCQELIKQFSKKPSFIWIKREQNSEADELSKSEFDKHGIETKTHSDDKTVFTFGKYSGKSVNDIEDMQYLQWVLKNVKIKQAFRQLIVKRVSNFEYLAK